MNTETKHTPERLTTSDRGNLIYITTEGRSYIARVDLLQADHGDDEQTRANAARLVACWNNHDDMAKELETLRPTVGSLRAAVGIRDKEIAQLKADKAELVFALQSAFDELNSLATEPNELGPQKQNVSIPICALTLDLARALIKKYENPS